MTSETLTSPESWLNVLVNGFPEKSFNVLKVSSNWKRSDTLYFLLKWIEKFIKEFILKSPVFG